MKITFPSIYSLYPIYTLWFGSVEPHILEAEFIIKNSLSTLSDKKGRVLEPYSGQEELYRELIDTTPKGLKCIYHTVDPNQEDSSYGLEIGLENIDPDPDTNYDLILMGCNGLLSAPPDPNLGHPSVQSLIETLGHAKKLLNPNGSIMASVFPDSSMNGFPIGHEKQVIDLEGTQTLADLLEIVPNLDTSNGVFTSCSQETNPLSNVTVSIVNVVDSKGNVLIDFEEPLLLVGFDLSEFMSIIRQSGLYPLDIVTRDIKTSGTTPTLMWLKPSRSDIHVKTSTVYPSIVDYTDKDCMVYHKDDSGVLSPTSILPDRLPIRSNAPYMFSYDRSLVMGSLSKGDYPNIMYDVAYDYMYQLVKGETLKNDYIRDLSAHLATDLKLNITRRIDPDVTIKPHKWSSLPPSRFTDLENAIPYINSGSDDKFKWAVFMYDDEEVPTIITVLEYLGNVLVVVNSDTCDIKLELLRIRLGLSPLYFNWGNSYIITL